MPTTGDLDTTRRGRPRSQDRTKRSPGHVHTVVAILVGVGAAFVRPQVVVAAAAMGSATSTETPVPQVSPRAPSPDVAAAFETPSAASTSAQRPGSLGKQGEPKRRFKKVTSKREKRHFAYVYKDPLGRFRLYLRHDGRMVVKGGSLGTWLVARPPAMCVTGFCQPVSRRSGDRPHWFVPDPSGYAMLRDAGLGAAWTGAPAIPAGHAYRFGYPLLDSSRVLGIPLAYVGAFGVVPRGTQAIDEAIDATREERQQLRAKVDERALRYATERFVDELLAIWRDPSRDLPAKKRLLHARWREIDVAPEATAAGSLGVPEPSPSELARRAAGRLARERLERFVRLVMPEGSPQSYTKAELAELNDGCGPGSCFAPYGPQGAAP